MEENKKYKILVVDDDERNRLLIKVILKKEGYEVIEAEDGKKCLEKVKKENPDLILMDVMMPQMDGFTATEILKSDNNTKNIPIIILTALNEREEKLKGIEKGANDFLTKPIDTKELLLKIKNNL